MGRFPSRHRGATGESTTSGALAFGGLDPEEIALEKAQTHRPLLLATIFDTSSIEAAQRNLATSIVPDGATGRIFAANPDARASGPHPKW